MLMVGLNWRKGNVRNPTLSQRRAIRAGHPAVSGQWSVVTCQNWLVVAGRLSVVCKGFPHPVQKRRQDGAPKARRVYCCGCWGGCCGGGCCGGGCCCG